ncbi:DUF3299 domain-containing protein [Larkinella sp. C7]|jgi:hypothetical protein|uniref:DUF3299 domain-containing protein n=1 Tax=Larkinella sp. C7 TaxID=2576607 RepID=UPI001111336F|nr:DUF3299 domain-containing protein [Larkinella sp. C7]
MVRLVLMLSWGLGTFTAFGVEPQPVSWERLQDVKFKKKWYPEENVIMLYPNFGPSVKVLDGKTVAITGYVIPLDVDHSAYVVSRFPMAQCFFCGAAGPESIVMLKFKSPVRRFKTDERRTFRGTFRLNADNIYELNYILEKAEWTER